MKIVKHKQKYYENPCRPCITGDKHYEVSCNTCETRTEKAKGILHNGVRR